PDARGGGPAGPGDGGGTDHPARRHRTGGKLNRWRAARTHVTPLAARVASTEDRGYAPDKGQSAPEAGPDTGRPHGDGRSPRCSTHPPSLLVCATPRRAPPLTCPRGPTRASGQCPPRPSSPATRSCANWAAAAWASSTSPTSTL